MTCRVIVGDVRQTLPTLASGSVRCVVTSPPYWGLRDYGMAGQLGLERTPEEYVANLVGVMREVRRVLADDGTLWLNLGDSYAANRSYQVRDNKHIDVGNDMAMNVPPGLKPKDLVMIPARVALALQADGWYLRSDIIWAKPNPMPESVTDRPTKAHEYVFLLSKAARYFYDADAIREPNSSPEQLAHNLRYAKPYAAYDSRALATGQPGNENNRGIHGRPGKRDKQRGHSRRHAGFNDRWDQMERAEQIQGGRNARSVWEIATQPYPEAHFATFPEELARRCILAGSAPGDVVLDPFGGSGTVGAVAIGNGRGAVLCELNPKYADLAVQRVGPMYATVAA